MKVYEQWCTDPYFDDETKKELLAIKDDKAEIEDRFYRQLEFGTGGLRGVIGAGTNRMNIYTVRQATQGLANYIISQNGQSKGVAIAYDSRIMSKEFADEAALCLNANGIKAYVFPSLRPTPELSFSVRELHCISGIVITASHNPREYNGYKVYWEDGAQITPPHDKNILAEVAKVTEFSAVKTMDKDEAVKAGLYNVIGEDIDDKYMEQLKKQSIHPDIIKKMAKDIHDKYVDPPFTTDFAIMFLPFESIYAEVIRRTSLIETLQKEYKIVVTGPTTLGAILNSLQMGFRTLAIQKRTGEVWTVLGAVKTEFSKFGGLLEKVQKNLQSAGDQLEEVMGKRTRAIERKLRQVEQLPHEESQKILPIDVEDDLTDY